jgi:hypothetical protein
VFKNARRRSLEVTMFYFWALPADAQKFEALINVCSELSVFVHELMHNWVVLKTILNLTLKLTLKGSYMFRCEEHHPQGAHYLSLAKVIIVNWSKFRPVPHTYTNNDQTIIYAAEPPNEPRQCILTHFHNCNFSKPQIVCSWGWCFSHRNI